MFVETGAKNVRSKITASEWTKQAQSAFWEGKRFIAHFCADKCVFCSDEKRPVCRNDKPLSNCKLAQQQSTFFFLLLLPSFSHRLSHTQTFSALQSFVQAWPEVCSLRNSLTLAPTCVITPWPLLPPPLLAWLPFATPRLQIHFLHITYSYVCLLDSLLVLLVLHVLFFWQNSFSLLNLSGLSIRLLISWPSLSGLFTRFLPHYEKSLAAFFINNWDIFIVVVFWRQLESCSSTSQSKAQHVCRWNMVVDVRLQTSPHLSPDSCYRSFHLFTLILSQMAAVLAEGLAAVARLIFWLHITALSLDQWLHHDNGSLIAAYVLQIWRNHIMWTTQPHAWNLCKGLKCANEHLKFSFKNCTDITVHGFSHNVKRLF